MTASPLINSLIIRQMRTQDLEQVHVIDRLSFSLPWPESAYRYELNENPSSLLWVAEVTSPEGQRKVVGMIVVWVILDEMHIATLAVHPDFRGQGMAKELLVTALKEAIHLNLRVVTLEVRAHNEIAQRLYRLFGFEIAGLRPHYYRDNGEDAFIMTLNNLGRTYLEWLESEAWRKDER